MSRYIKKKFIFLGERRKSRSKTLWIYTLHTPKLNDKKQKTIEDTFGMCVCVWMCSFGKFFLWFRTKFFFSLFLFIVVDLYLLHSVVLLILVAFCRRLLSPILFSLERVNFVRVYCIKLCGTSERPRVECGWAFWVYFTFGIYSDVNNCTCVAIFHLEANSSNISS